MSVIIPAVCNTCHREFCLPAEEPAKAIACPYGCQPPYSIDEIRRILKRNQELEAMHEESKRYPNWVNLGGVVQE